MRRLLTLSFLLACLFGCQSVAPNADPSSTQYYQLYDAQNKTKLSLQQVSAIALKVDVVFIGEFHTHPASHRFELDMLKSLIAHERPVMLSLEQFSRDAQSSLNAYLIGEIDESELSEQVEMWPNYEADYKPLINWAKQSDVGVVAANAPTAIVRCIGRQGTNYLTKLTPGEEAWIAEDITLSTKAYEQRFRSFFEDAGAGHKQMGKRLQAMYEAQLSRDNTMAESILTAKRANPEHLILHLNGAFHSNEMLGTVAVLKARAPELEVLVISPAYAEELERDETWRRGQVLQQINKRSQQNNPQMTRSKLQCR